jgi:hypothetical protein
LLLLAGCRRNKSSGGPEQQTSDSALTSQIEAKLQQDATLKTRTIRVTAQQGAVTLSGEVGDDSEKVTAEKLAGDVGSVKQIVDLLAVAVAQPPPSQPGSGIATQSQPSETNPQCPAGTHSAQQQPSDLPLVVEEPANTETRPQTTQPTEPVDNAPPPMPPPQPAPVTVPAGTIVSVSMIDSIDSASNQAGQTFAASVSAPVALDNQVVIPQGADARVRLAEDRSAGHFRGRSLLKVELVSVTAHGTSYNVQTDPVEKQGASRGKNTAEKIGGGAGVGAIIGGIFGHGKGAATGVGLGAGAGVVDQGLTHAKRVKIASEERLDFTLRSPLTLQVPAARSTNP